MSSSPQINLFGGQINLFGDQLNLFGDQISLVGDQINLFGDQVNLFGDQNNLFGDQISLFGDQINLFGDQVNPFRTQNKAQEKNGYQQSTKPAVSHNQSINYKMSDKRARHSIRTCINLDDCAHQCRLSARQLRRQPHYYMSNNLEIVNLLDCL